MRTNTQGEAPVHALHSRRFKMIIFDWDGTAVASRTHPADGIIWRSEALLDRGVWLAAVTGTNFANLSSQFASRLNPSVRQRALFCTNRGSEVYGSSADGQHALRLHARIATEAEDEAMDRAARRIQHELREQYGLETQIIHGRMNRRKLDLIPLPQWADPLKEQLPALHRAVEARLAFCGVSGGLAEIVARTRAMCADEGIDARITTDVKHVELGLTDKSDSVRYLIEQVAAMNAIGASEILILGDEFGPIGGVEGSDYKLLIPAVRDSLCISVGSEPCGVPAGVAHLGGGADTFTAILEAQMRAWRNEPPDSPTTLSFPLSFCRPTDPWQLRESGDCNAGVSVLDRETMFTLGNGYMATRGSHEDGLLAGGSATFIAGVFDCDPAPDEVTELVSMPDWLPVEVLLDGQTALSPFEPSCAREAPRSCHYDRSCDLAQACIRRTVRLRNRAGCVLRIESRRFVSLADRHLACMRYEVVMEAGAGEVQLNSFIDGDVTNRDSGARHLDILGVHAPRRHGASPGIAGVDACTINSHIPIAVALASTAFVESANSDPDPADSEQCAASRRPLEPSPLQRHHAAGHKFRAYLRPGDRLVLEKFAVYRTGRDVRTAFAGPEPASGEASPASLPPSGISPLLGAACRSAEAAARVGYDLLFAAHVREWAARWSRCDVRIWGPDRDQLGIRFAIFHMLVCAPDTDDRVSIGAKGLHGEGYRGHVFWDTEVFVHPFFCAVFPATARNLLMYRYHTLPGARRKAAGRGYRGAMFAWESADSGDETTPAWTKPDPATGRRIRIWCGDTEDHITADVAHAVWTYWQWTGDDEFFRDYGAEIVIEAGRFWASRATWNEQESRYEYLRVIGPDEYHENIDNNAFTNYMAKWTIEAALSASEWLATNHPSTWRDLSGRLDLTRGEQDEMRRVAQAVYLPLPDPGTGVIEQFDGFWDLEDITGGIQDLIDAGRPADMALIQDMARHRRLLKQADVVMLAKLLPDLFDRDTWAANYDYYSARTAHGSSLSPSAHALVAARLGRDDQAYRHFQRSLALDLCDSMGNLGDGIHMANLGGIWQAAVFGFAGARLDAQAEHGIRVAPLLPDAWDRLEASIVVRGRRARLAVTRCRTELTWE
jgi:trehalose/maltose hydrolase-like predicted phosphorylase